MIRSDSTKRRMIVPVTGATARFAAYSRSLLVRGLLAAVVLLVLVLALAVQPPVWASAAWIEEGRIARLCLAALLLGGLAWHQHRTQSQLLGLAAWPEAGSEDDQTFRRVSLQYVRILHAARRVLLVEETAGGLDVLACEGFGLRQTRLAMPAAAALAGALSGTSFYCNTFHRRVRRVRFRSPVGFQQWRGDPIHSLLMPWLDGRRMMSYLITTEFTTARLFVLDGHYGSRSTLLFGEAVGEAFASRIERRIRSARGRDLAVGEERNRFSRDLHDGLLQSMTAWGLHLGDLAQRLQGVDSAAAEHVDDVRRQIGDDQRELRRLIGRLHANVSDPVDFSLIGRLHDLRERFAQEWGLTVDVDFSGLHALVPPALRAEVCRLLHEALANAARHSQTSLVRVEVAASDAGIFLAVRDRGCGFPFVGRLDLAALRRQQQGPASLIERVTALDGELVIESSAAGASVEILLPLDQSRDRANEHAS
jgi:signal transduction histidine kinase